MRIQFSLASHPSNRLGLLLRARHFAAVPGPLFSVPLISPERVPGPGNRLFVRALIQLRWRAMPSSGDGRDWPTVTQAAERLAIPRNAVIYAIEAGRLNANRVDGVWHVDPSTIASYVRLPRAQARPSAGHPWRRGYKGTPPTA